MYIPATAPFAQPQPYVSDPNSHLILAGSGKGSNGGGGGGGSNGWSSLIGVATAICGNILISFALNTQRYAHLRLSRDRQECEEKQQQRQTSGRAASDQQRSYGSVQEAIAEERATENAKSEPHSDGRDGGWTGSGESGEREPLIPRLGKDNGSRDETDGEGSEDEAEQDDDEDQEGNDSHGNSYLKSPIWWVGIGLMVLGEAGNFLAYGFAPASIVSPLGVVALVSNCLIAPLLLGEPFRWRDGLGVIIAIAGAVTVVLSASDSNPRLTPDKIWHLITQWEFETYFGVSVFLVVVLSVASNKFGDRTVLVDLGLVALYGGYTALSTKGIASLLSNTIWRVVTFPITYLLVAVLVLTAVMQIKYVNRALQRFNATQVIPTQFVLFTISVIVGSAVLYRDFETEAAGDAAKFVGGCALTFLGVWCITSGHNDESEADEEMAEEDDAVDLHDEEHVQPEIREREDGSDTRHTVVPSSSNEALQPDRNRSESTAPSVVVTPAMDPGTSTDHAPYLDLDHSFSNESTQDIPPATAAAIHSKSIEELAQTPDRKADQRKPQLHATTSTPLIPHNQQPQPSNADSPSRPHTPLNRNMTGPPTSPSPLKRSPATPSAGRRRSQPFLDPNTTTPPPAQTATASRMLNRSTTAASSVVGGLFPGPLTSPLSSSLSAIVADSLRRGTLDASYSSPGLPGGGVAGAGGPGTLRRRGTTAAAAAAAGPRRPGTAQRGSSSLRVPAGSAGAVSTAAAGRKRHSIASGAGGVGSGGMLGGSSERNPPGREEVEGETAGSRPPVQGEGSPPAGSARNRSLPATMGNLFGGSLRRQRSGEEG
ncbi:DUF803-domain-containing protein [Hortaea werneckii]|nr:DUF803-domain-containing protein [Hortaea werneckii]KAI7045233.1 DUF803-domain-containing protein [Hortaea werneckii]KAI7260577.1 DUF803-domain-containing protein [Hortaea werneckii]KAI7387296.1 DUF803-domain-containing protein [Hortaea werneckii]KAI7434767.1 DUF803-domain-containing protein [Hortaea werneckii]